MEVRPQVAKPKMPMTSEVMASPVAGGFAVLIGRTATGLVMTGIVGIAGDAACPLNTSETGFQSVIPSVQRMSVVCTVPSLRPCRI